MPEIILFGQHFESDLTSQILCKIAEFIKSGEVRTLGTINVFLITECSNNPWLSDFYNQCDLVTVDGQPLVYASRFFSSCPFPEMVGGPNLFSQLYQAGASNGWSFYFLGSTNQILEKAELNLRAMYPSFDIVGKHHGYFDPESKTMDDIIQEITDKKPDVICVGMPTPKKEQVSHILKKRLKKGSIVLVGGSFDYFAGEKKIGNPLVSRLCLDWFFRMMQEPRRLFKRYLKSNMQFLRLFLAEFTK